MLLAHAVAFGLLYALLVFIGWAFHDHYNAVGYALTPRFLTIHHLGQLVSAYTVPVLTIVGLNLLIVFRLACKRPRLATAYSHSILMLVGFLAFVSLVWMINPMAWGRPNAPAPPMNAGLVPGATDLPSSVAARKP